MSVNAVSLTHIPLSLLPPTGSLSPPSPAFVPIITTSLFSSLVCFPASSSPFTEFLSFASLFLQPFSLFSYLFSLIFTQRISSYFLHPSPPPLPTHLLWLILSYAPSCLFMWLQPDRKWLTPFGGWVTHFLFPSLLYFLILRSYSSFCCCFLFQYKKDEWTNKRTKTNWPTLLSICLFHHAPSSLSDYSTFTVLPLSVETGAEVELNMSEHLSPFLSLMTAAEVGR